MDSLWHVASCKSKQAAYALSSWCYIQLQYIIQGAEGIQRRKIKMIKSLDLRSLWSKEQGLGSQEKTEMGRINTQSFNMQNTAADVTVLDAYADRTSNMIDQK